MPTEETNVMPTEETNARKRRSRSTWILGVVLFLAPIVLAQDAMAQLRDRISERRMRRYQVLSQPWSYRNDEETIARNEGSIATSSTTWIFTAQRLSARTTSSRASRKPATRCKSSMTRLSAQFP